MQTHEYKAIPAPRKAVSSKGVKGTPARFANAVTTLMNEMAADGWSYQRTDTLPCEERQGLTGKAVKYHALMVFSRPVSDESDQDETLALPGPQDDEIAEEAFEDTVEDVVEEDHASADNNDQDGDAEDPSTRDV